MLQWAAGNSGFLIEMLNWMEKCWFPAFSMQHCVFFRRKTTKKKGKKALNLNYLSIPTSFSAGPGWTNQIQSQSKHTVLFRHMNVSCSKLLLWAFYGTNICKLTNEQEGPCYPPALCDLPFHLIYSVFFSKTTPPVDSYVTSAGFTRPFILPRSFVTLLSVFSGTRLSAKSCHWPQLGGALLKSGRSYAHKQTFGKWRQHLRPIFSVVSVTTR